MAGFGLHGDFVGRMIYDENGEQGVVLAAFECRVIGAEVGFVGQWRGEGEECAFDVMGLELVDQEALEDHEVSCAEALVIVPGGHRWKEIDDGRSQGQEVGDNGLGNRGRTDGVEGISDDAEVRHVLEAGEAAVEVLLDVGGMEIGFNEMDPIVPVCQQGEGVAEIRVDGGAVIEVGRVTSKFHVEELPIGTSQRRAEDVVVVDDCKFDVLVDEAFGNRQMGNQADVAVGSRQIFNRGGQYLHLFGRLGIGTYNKDFFHCGLGSVVIPSERTAGLTITRWRAL